MICVSTSWWIGAQCVQVFYSWASAPENQSLAPDCRSWWGAMCLRRPLLSKARLRQELPSALLSMVPELQIVCCMQVGYNGCSNLASDWRVPHLDHFDFTEVTLDVLRILTWFSRHDRATPGCLLPNSNQFAVVVIFSGWKLSGALNSPMFSKQGCRPGGWWHHVHSELPSKKHCECLDSETLGSCRPTDNGQGIFSAVKVVSPSLMCHFELKLRQKKKRGALWFILEHSSPSLWNNFTPSTWTRNHRVCNRH